ncbi:sporulation YhaL family protein [Virgibacillus soli]|uniref:Sporulation YhaL family protein n=1 Tax=Paracerasibacillus soli TaxID=480284 RepID=A0ABU5CN68_9BACI|nr:sporulation YhaL family protein [Virgibacillus soli]MDY0407812.1 sporulation YhaL family protein [Virgibacillus soli]
MVLFGLPWWVLLIILLIFTTGYMAFRAMRAERELEQQYIEREGKIFLERIEAERQKKSNANQQMSGS